MPHCAKTGGRARAAGRAAALAAFALAVSGASAAAQIAQLMKAVADGGGWVRLPVEEGRASYVSPAVPVAGLALSGCVRVWDGHSGQWTISAEDRLGDSRLHATASPGEGVRFEFKGGLRAQLGVAVEWSEPRDTALYMWVGVAPRAEAGAEDGEGRDLCQPPPTRREREADRPRRR